MQVLSSVPVLRRSRVGGVRQANLPRHRSPQIFVELTKRSGERRDRLVVTWGKVASPYGGPQLHAAASWAVREAREHSDPCRNRRFSRASGSPAAWSAPRVARKGPGRYPTSMRASKGWSSAVVMTLFVACTRVGGSPTPAGSPLTLKIVLTKPEFFEGEPIYGLFELRNVSSDTVRLPPLGFNSGWLSGVVHRADGSVVPGGRSAWIDYVCFKTCNDDPVAPGGARSSPFIAQEFWGEPGPLSSTTLYRR